LAAEQCVSKPVVGLSIYTYITCIHALLMRICKKHQPNNTTRMLYYYDHQPHSAGYNAANFSYCWLVAFPSKPTAKKKCQLQILGMTEFQGYT
jgi:hypothetical protein